MLIEFMLVLQSLCRPAWEFPLAATLPFFVLTFGIMCYTNGVGASTGGPHAQSCSRGEGEGGAHRGLCSPLPRVVQPSTAAGLPQGH